MPSLRPTIAIVSREVWPFFEGGGIGRYVRAAASMLAPHADVTILLPDFYRGTVPDDHPGLLRDARYAFVPEPDRENLHPFGSLYHAWSAAACDALRRLYPHAGPDLVEFNEYTGEGAVTIQAKRSADPALTRTRVIVGIHGTDELHRILNGQDLLEPEAAALTSLERLALAQADLIFSPGGDVHGTYLRHYGRDALAPHQEVPHPFAWRDRPKHAEQRRPGPLRLLHLGRYERRKGVLELVDAFREREDDDLALTMVGGDTPTGPGGRSMRDHLELLCAGDPRLRLLDRVAHADALRMISDHDVVVVPSRWETNANVAREALMLGRPVLATATGGLVQIVKDGWNGWLTDPGHDGVASGIARVLADEGRVPAEAQEGGLPATLSRSVSDDDSRAAYLRTARAAPQAPALTPTLGVVITAASGADPQATIASVHRQTHVPTAVVTSRSGRGGAVGDLVGASAAVAVVDAGTELSPSFLERCARALAASPEYAYVSTWGQASDPWQARPLGNRVPLLQSEDCGGAVMVVRSAHARGVAERVGSSELAGAGAWVAARELAHRKAFGIIVPEELTRVVEPSASSHGRRAEVEAALLRGRTRWRSDRR